MTPTVVAFDLYGTLLSTGSIAQELAKIYGEDKAKTIASQARRYQLEYSWRVSSMGMYRPFGDLTRSSFRQATKEIGVELSPEQEERIMNAYDGLDTFPDVDEALTFLSNTPSLTPYIFSNGTEKMITSSLTTSPSLAKASSILPAANVISVDSLKVFKPDPRTYEHLLETVAPGQSRDTVWLVSSNPFDALGAVAAGLKSAWVDRGGLGWVDGLGDALHMRPSLVVQGVDEAVKKIAGLSG